MEKMKHELEFRKTEGMEPRGTRRSVRLWTRFIRLAVVINTMLL
jgi:hypothetical protein